MDKSFKVKKDAPSSAVGQALIFHVKVYACLEQSFKPPSPIRI